MRKDPIDLTSLIGQEDRDFIVVALQALWRERVAARNACEAVSHTTPHEQKAFDLVNGEALFGIEAAAQMLRRVGAAPLA